MLGPGMYTQSTGPCSDCGGSGEQIDEALKCKQCNGKKVMKEKKKSSQQALRSNADFSGITSIRDILNVINQVLFLESESGCMKIPTLMSE